MCDYFLFWNYYDDKMWILGSFGHWSETSVKNTPINFSSKHFYTACIKRIFQHDVLETWKDDVGIFSFVSLVMKKDRNSTFLLKRGRSCFHEKKIFFYKRLASTY